MSSNRPDFGLNLRLEDVFGSPAVQQSAADATDYMANISPRKKEEEARSNVEASVNLIDGTMTYKGPVDAVKNTLGKATNYDDIQRIYAQSLAELQRERAAQAAHPFANTLAQIGAAIAAGDRDPRVRSLGQLAQNLNPTPQTLRERELDVLQQAGNYAIMRDRTAMEGKRLAFEEKRLGLEKQRIQQAAARAVKTDLATMERWAGQDARSGLFDATSATSYVNERVAAGDTPDHAVASAIRMKATSDQAKAVKELEEARKDAKTQLDRDRLDEMIRHNQESGSQRDRQLDQLQSKIDKGLEKKTEIKGKDAKEVRELLIARKSGQDLLALFDPNTTNPEFKKAQKLMGPIRGRWVELRKKFGNLKPDEAYVVNKVMVQFVNAVSTMGTGTYGYRISERGFVKDFTEAMKNEPGQNYGNLRRWMEFYDTKLQVMANQYGVPVEELDKLIETKPTGGKPAAPEPAEGESPYPWEKKK